jgi:hypothetical protein
MKNLKSNLLIGYLAIGLIYAIYSSNFGIYKYKGLAFNIGRGLVWPASMFPSFGKFVGGILIIAFVIYITMKKN